MTLSYSLSCWMAKFTFSGEQNTLILHQIEITLLEFYRIFSIAHHRGSLTCNYLLSFERERLIRWHLRDICLCFWNLELLQGVIWTAIDKTHKSFEASNVSKSKYWYLDELLERKITVFKGCSDIACTLLLTKRYKFT